MVEQTFVVRIPATVEADIHNLQSEMARALSVWFHRNVTVEVTDTFTTDAA